MKNIVITGSTRGIGLGLAAAFLDRGCSVTINGTSDESIAGAISRLRGHEGRVQGVAGTVSERDTAERLFEAARRQYGPIDIWVNNAGIGQPQKKVWDLDNAIISNVLDVNLLGVINGTSVPYQMMEKQGSGKIFNMEGLGSDGFILDRMSIYGTSKCAVHYFTKAFANEIKGSSVQIGLVSPGMVVTDLLRETVADDSEESLKKKKFYTLLADDTETVAVFLVEKMLASSKPFERIQWLTKQKVLFRLLFGNHHEK
ncbi:MAG: SDR family oxidoreductase [Chlorobiaceae bacterium]|nr:SDR family oxidoreductase [Chlorobiaceae bacterium]